MQITYLKLLNFRNYEKLELSFSSNTNLIYGKNGMGKTNLVEAIYVLSLTKSFRGSSDKVLINESKDVLKITGKINDDITRDYQIIINNKGKNVKIDNNLCKKISDYISRINVILFNPDDLKFIKESPSIRRKYLNIDISNLDNEYLIYLSNYNKLLKQRNAYLKTMYYNANASSDYLNILTEKLVDFGIKIHQKRSLYIENINKYLGSLYKKISVKSDLFMKYVSSYDNLDKDKILMKYKELEEKDKLFGKTSFGIHHDDILFYLDNIVIKDYGSEGQQKNAIIAYKLAQIEVFKSIKNKKPILILDDLFSELDSEKINNILGLLDNDIQTFITTTDIDKVNQNIKNNSKLFKVDEEGIMEVKL